MSVKDYWNKLNVLFGASVGIVISKTSEPYRCHTAIRDFVVATNQQRKEQNKPAYEYRLWTSTYGFSKFDLENLNAQPIPDESTTDPFLALNQIHAVGGPGVYKDGVFTMMFPHYFFSPEEGKVSNPLITQRLLEYARDFTDAQVRKRLILIMPPHFTLPAELQDSVAILDFDTPTVEELQPIYEEVVGSLDVSRQPRYSEAEIDRILSLGAGMTSSEFENACSRALVQERAKLPNLPIDDLCTHIASVKTEVVKRSEVLELLENVDMSQVGGLDALKEWVNDLRYSFSKEAREFGVDAPKGCAVVGPSP